MKSGFFWLVAPVVCLALLQTACSPSFAKQKQETYDQVKASRWFAIGGVGLANTPSAEEQAFRELLRQSEPVARCRKLLAEGTPAGQMYGLLGLRLLDRQAFKIALPQYRGNQTVVTTAEGCLVTYSTASDLVQRIEWGLY